MVPLFYLFMCSQEYMLKVVGKSNNHNKKRENSYLLLVERI